MVKKLTAATAAKQVIEAGRPVVEFRVTASDLKQATDALKEVSANSGVAPAPLGQGR
jgi:hypothetical protein